MSSYAYRITSKFRLVQVRVRLLGVHAPGIECKALDGKPAPPPPGRAVRPGAGAAVKVIVRDGAATAETVKHGQNYGAPDGRGPLAAGGWLKHATRKASMKALSISRSKSRLATGERM